jgi:hypothetical protein
MAQKTMLRAVRSSMSLLYECTNIWHGSTESRFSWRGRRRSRFVGGPSLTYFRDHATPYECLPLPHSHTPRSPIRRIARPPTPQLSSRFDSRASHARKLLPEASTSVPFWIFISTNSSSSSFETVIGQVLSISASGSPECWAMRASSNDK